MIGILIYKRKLHRIIDLFRLKKTLQPLSPDIYSALRSSPLNRVPKCHICTSLKYLQGWWFNHYPRQPLPVCQYVHKGLKKKRNNEAALCHEKHLTVAVGKKNLRETGMQGDTALSLLGRDQLVSWKWGTCGH